jgi:DNA gyrase inhibitor GyrI
MHLDPIALANLTAMVTQHMGVAHDDPKVTEAVRLTAQAMTSDPTHARALGGWPQVKGAGHR